MTTATPVQTPATPATHHAHTAHTQTPQQALTAAKTEVRRLEALKTSLPHAIHDAAAQGDTASLREARAQLGEVDDFLEAARVAVARAVVAVARADLATAEVAMGPASDAFMAADTAYKGAKGAWDEAQRGFMAAQGRIQVAALARINAQQALSEAEARVAQMTASLPGVALLTARKGDHPHADL